MNGAVAVADIRQRLQVAHILDALLDEAGITPDELVTVHGFDRGTIDDLLTPVDRPKMRGTQRRTLQRLAELLREREVRDLDRNALVHALRPGAEPAEVFGWRGESSARLLEQVSRELRGLPEEKASQVLAITLAVIDVAGAAS